MRILAVGLRIYLGDLYLSLIREGHEVRVFASDTPDQHAFGGIIVPVDDWTTHLPWVGCGGLVLFEGLGQGAVQDALRKQGYRVVGGSAFGDRLEADRPFGQSILAEAGLQIAQNHAFSSPTDALTWLEQNPGVYVLKYDDNAHATFIGTHPKGADLAFTLRRYSKAGQVLLMERLLGVEVGIGGYFD